MLVDAVPHVGGTDVDSGVGWGFLMNVLPSGVTLEPIDGGPTYYADHGFTNAVSMGWDSPNFFPIGPFDSSYSSQTDVNTWSALGWNTAFADGGINLLLAASHGISVIEQGYWGVVFPQML